MGEVCHLRPADLRTMTLEQIYAAYIYATTDD